MQEGRRSIKKGPVIPPFPLVSFFFICLLSCFFSIGTYAHRENEFKRYEGDYLSAWGIQYDYVRLCSWTVMRHLEMWFSICRGGIRTLIANGGSVKHASVRMKQVFVYGTYRCVRSLPPCNPYNRPSTCDEPWNIFCTMSEFSILYGGVCRFP